MQQLNAILALLLVHDLLLAKKGIAAPQSHPLHAAVARHKARISAEFTKHRLRLGFHSLDALRTSINDGELNQQDTSAAKVIPHPRWVRINALKTSLDEQLTTTFKSYQQRERLTEILLASGIQKSFYVDENIPDLIALPPKADVSGSEAYKSGHIIFQDKASCFSAYLLAIDSTDGDIIDACAAPGNKTTHLVAMSKANPDDGPKRRVLAFERDRQRTKILQKMVAAAGANESVSIAGATDYLQQIPTDKRYKNVTAILLDPSCSGSGIVGRDDEPTLYLPSLDSTAQPPSGSKSKKRKRETREYIPAEPENEATVTGTEKDTETRLEALSKFQLSILEHAMSFPAAKKIVYSTCSVHFQENEGVIINALRSKIAKGGGWRLLSRPEQAEGLRRWEIRGDEASCVESLATIASDSETLNANDIAESCIRCEKGTTAGTMGFFVAGFIRTDIPENPSTVNTSENDESEEWNGFSDAE